MKFRRGFKTVMYGLTRAPELDRNGLHWFNTDYNLSLASLRGRMVILDFWTSCCINCLHVQPTLKLIEDTFPDEVVVIGVHSPKFTAEHNPDNVRHAINRYGILHPVIHDPAMQLWQEYAVHAWPTLTFIGPDGRVLGNMSGEPDPDRIIQGIRQMLTGWKRAGLMKPVPFPHNASPNGGGNLCFPTTMKPIPCPGGECWAVADTGHSQIVIYDQNGFERRRFGSGHEGLQDGPPALATFNKPRGLIGDHNYLYVADTGNHALRRIDLKNGDIQTLAGNGSRGEALTGVTEAKGLELASPWDLELLDDRLFFSNAGTHQIGELSLARGTIRPLAGTSAEHIVDGPALDALLAQPSGLSLDADKGILYFTDTESSSVRQVTLCREPTVTTLVGKGLFDFGHDNGTFDTATLQHPLGLTSHNGHIVVADTFNDRLRLLDLKRCHVSDLGEDKFIEAANPVHASGPKGVAFAPDGTLLMSDTNNHRILEISLDNQRVKTWTG